MSIERFDPEDGSMEPFALGDWVLYEDAEEALLAERAACAELVEATGCLCWILEEADAAFRGEVSEWGLDGGIVTREIVQHDPRCPQALAAAILARGKS